MTALEVVSKIEDLVKITFELEKLIADALSSVHYHPQHDLNLGYRQAIWSALEPDKINSC
ncbi:hypothetical protein [Microseira sp. BLCC-F43]|jgi:hypothetical protein|uniref:hypothetical protein n=1 Tax=Microseira sp. BLCC-F43 TaxID=3153602 RepID=UPI0035B90842